MNDAKIARTVGCGRLLRVGCVVDNGDGSATDDGAGRIDHCASYRAIDSRLGVAVGSHQGTKQDQQGEHTESSSSKHLALLKIGVVLLLDVNQYRGRARSGIAGCVAETRDASSCQHFRKPLTKYGRVFLHERKF
jgi:hypothetical protein